MFEAACCLRWLTIHRSGLSRRLGAGPWVTIPMCVSARWARASFISLPGMFLSFAGDDRRTRRADESDILIKSPSNDPLTANAIARTLIELRARASGHQKYRDRLLEGATTIGCQIVRTSPDRQDHRLGWHELSQTHPEVPDAGIYLTALNPKYSMSLIAVTPSPAGRNDEAAIGLATMAGFYNQTCPAPIHRIVYVESGTEDDAIENIISLGRKLCCLCPLPPHALEAIHCPQPGAGSRDGSDARIIFYHVEGDTLTVASLCRSSMIGSNSYDKLNNRVSLRAG